MEKMILSLKNIYKLLMTNDFPIYSESVIGERNRKGQTLLRFWQSLIAAEFRCLPYGQMIWRNDGKRNRYISNLCNRSAQLRLYREYAGELAQQADAAALLSQVNRFIGFLSDKAYKHDVLMRRVVEFLRLLRTEDPCVSEEIAAQLNDAVEPGEWLAACGAEGRAFQAGYLLTMLSLYAAAGEAMGDPVLCVLRDASCSLRALWTLYSEKKMQQHEQTVFLTVHDGLLQDNLLSPERFFGREEELYDLLELAAAQRKCLISGIGGMGKTELLRQLIGRCVQQRTVEVMAVVPYEGNVMESFARAFKGFCRWEPEESFHQVLTRLERVCEEGKKTLLVLDDVSSGEEEDPALEELAGLPCSVIVTSRRSSLNGFETFRLQSPSVSTGALIFRDNYGFPLSREDRALLQDVLQDKALCHPLTLRLMARAARARKWPVTRLKAQLEENGVSLTWKEEERTVRLEQMYHQLYSLMRIPGECQALAELFTMLPRESYAQEFLLAFFPSVTGDAQQLHDRLEVLVQGGWLDADETGVSMHPLIAQCLRRKIITDSRITAVFARIIEKLNDVYVCFAPLYRDAVIQRIGSLMVYAAELVTGSVGAELLTAVMVAMSLLVFNKQSIERCAFLAGQMMKRCAEKNDAIEAMYCTVLGHWGMGDSEHVQALYRRLRELRTIPTRQYFDFCLFASNAMADNALVEQALGEVIDGEAVPYQKATALYHLCLLYNRLGNFEKLDEASAKALAYVKQHPECEEDLYFNCLSARCLIALQFGRQEEAKALIDEQQAAASESMLAMHKLQLANLAGTYELNYGSLEKALTWYEQQMTINVEYYGKDLNYYVGLGQIAIVQQRLRRYDDALDTYGVILRYAQETGERFMIQRFSNNVGVLYLEMGKPVKALEYLETALEEGRKMGSIALAEALRNCARAHAMTGDTARELAYLEEGAPLLEAVYGENHPRAAAAKERLAQLKRA